MQQKLYDTQFVKHHNIIAAEVTALQFERSLVLGTRSVAFDRESRRRDLTRMSPYPVAELQRKLTTT